MGWLQRLFGEDELQKAKGKSPAQSQSSDSSSSATRTSSPTLSKIQQTPQSERMAIPPERVGLDGNYDQSGLAKRVALAFDEDPDLDDIDTLYVAQISKTVVLKGKVPNRNLLDKMVAIAQQVKGAADVDISEVAVG